MEIDSNLDVKVSARTNPGAAVLDSSLGGYGPSPTIPSPLVETWIYIGRAYGGQENSDISALEGAETLSGAENLGVGDVDGGVK